MTTFHLSEVLISQEMLIQNIFVLEKGWGDIETIQYNNMMGQCLVTDTVHLVTSDTIFPYNVTLM